VFWRLAELEITAEERPRAGDVGLPEDTGEHIREWAEGEQGKVLEREELARELSEAMQARRHDPRAVKAMGG